MLADIVTFCTFINGTIMRMLKAFLESLKTKNQQLNNNNAEDRKICAV